MCDTLCIRTRAGTLFAKNSDRHPNEAQVTEWHPRRPAGGTVRTQYLEIPDEGAYAFVGSRPTWLWGVEHGVNEHGVAAGNEKIWTVDRPADRPALLGMDVVRLVLERARTADEALTVLTALVERYGQGGSGEPHRVEPYFSSFLVADPHAGWIVETSDRTWAARPTGHGAAISNRVTLTTDWTRASSDLAADTDFDTLRLARMPTAVADLRLRATTATVARGDAATPAEVAKTLRSHGSWPAIPNVAGEDLSGFTVCMHRPELHAQTTASLIAELRTDAPPRIWTALGNPCLGVFVPGFPPAIAPELADAAQWARFARLRDRVEKDPDEFASVTARVQAVEAELWDRADAATTPEQRRELALRAYAPVDATLHRLGV